MDKRSIIILYYRPLRGNSSPPPPQDGGILYSLTNHLFSPLQKHCIKNFRKSEAISFPRNTLYSVGAHVAGWFNFKKKKKVRACDVVIFPRISDQKSVFLRTDLEKNFSKEFHKQYAILFRCLLHQESYFSQRRNYSFYLQYYAQIFIYINH